MRTLFGAVMFGAGVLWLAVALTSAPSAQACQVINSVQQNLGNPAACSTAPDVLTVVLSVLLIVSGLVMVFSPRGR